MATAEAPKKKRLFVGTFLGDESRERLAELHENKSDLERGFGKKLRWTSPEKLHLTWLFLGYVEPPAIPEIQRTLSEIASRHAKLTLRFDQAEFWPSRRRARFFVLTPSVVPAAMANVADDTKSSLLKFVQNPEDRKYSPHLTIIRFDAASGKPLEVPESFQKLLLSPIELVVGQIDLIESRMASGSNTYHSLASFFLSN